MNDENEISKSLLLAEFDAKVLRAENPPENTDIRILSFLFFYLEKITFEQL